MMARCGWGAVCLALLAATGCVCRGPCGPVGGLGMGMAARHCPPGCGPCMPGLQYDRVWRGDCDGCVGGGCGMRCGLFPWLGCGLRRAACGGGCGDVYWGEWVSDPPDCCDPCNDCGQFTGGQCCHPRPLQRLWWGLHGYKLNDPCGRGNCGSCGGCGGAFAGYSGGCATCGGGGDAFDYGQPNRSILQENWEREPLPTTEPGKPVHNAKAPPQGRMTQYRQSRTQVAAPRPATPTRTSQMPASARPSGPAPRSAQYAPRPSQRIAGLSSLSGRYGE